MIMRILIIEDDQEAAAFIQKGLRESGHVVEHTTDGGQGLALSRGGGFDALVVDRMLPTMDGLSVIRTLRAEGNRTPALIHPGQPMMVFAVSRYSECVEKVTTQSTSLSTAATNDILIRDKKTVRLIFRPTLVDNPHKKEACLSSVFLYQKKAQSDAWIDFETIP